MLRQLPSALNTTHPITPELNARRTGIDDRPAAPSGRATGRVPVATAAVVVAALSAAGCATWRREGLAAAPHELVPRAEGRALRVTRADGSVLVVPAPHAVAGDSLVGGAGPHRVAVALADVRAVEVRRFDAARTGRAVVLGALGAAAAAYLALALLFAARGGYGDG
jgi:hypothetical protein